MISRHEYNMMVRGKKGDDLVNALLSNFDKLSGKEVVPPLSLLTPARPVCTECNEHLIHNQREGMMVCSVCGVVGGEYDGATAYQSRGNYGSTITMHQYKRITRFREVLRQLEGTAGGAIPENVRVILAMEMKKYRLTVASPEFVQQAFKKHKMGKWNEYAVRLAVETGYRAATFPPSLRQELECMFSQCDRQWPRIQKEMGRTRVNFPSYVSMIYNFLLILGETKLAALIRPRLLQSATLAQNNQIIWRAFCQRLQWPFRQLHGALNTTRQTQNSCLLGKRKVATPFRSVQKAPSATRGPVAVNQRQNSGINGFSTKTKPSTNPPLPGPRKTKTIARLEQKQSKPLPSKKSVPEQKPLQSNNPPPRRPGSIKRKKLKRPVHTSNTTERVLTKETQRLNNLRMTYLEELRELGSPIKEHNHSRVPEGKLTLSLYTTGSL